MTFIIAFLLGLGATLFTGGISKFGAGLLLPDAQARCAGVFVPIGFAIARYSFGGPPTLETLGHLSTAVGSIVAIVILWRLFLAKREADDVIG